MADIHAMAEGHSPAARGEPGAATAVLPPPLQRLSLHDEAVDHLDHGCAFVVLQFDLEVALTARILDTRVTADEAFFGELPKRAVNRDMVDDEDMANMIERLLLKISNHHKKKMGAELKKEKDK